MLRKTFFIILLLSSWNIVVSQTLSKSQIKKEVSALTEEYGLNKKQVEKVSEIVKKREQDIKTIQKDNSLSKRNKSRKLDAIQSGSTGSMLILLDEDQRRTLFEKKMAKDKEERIGKIK